MATNTSTRRKKMVAGICLCLAAGLFHIFLTGSTSAAAGNNPASLGATPTLTKTARLTQTPAPRFTSTSSELSEPEQIRATEASLFYDCGWSDQRITSEDGAWVASQCVGMKIGLYKPGDLSHHFFINYDDVYANKYADGYPGGKLRPVRFSADGQSFFFAPFLYGDGGCQVYEKDYGLFKLDLNSGQIAEQLPPIKGVLYDFAFSSKGDHLAYISTDNGHPTLHVLDLRKNTTRDISLDTTYSDAGSILWSPDDGQLLFSATTGEECFEKNYSVISLDLKDFHQTVIVQGSGKSLLPVKWIDAEHILVLTNFNPVFTILNINTGELEPESHPVEIPA